MTRNSEMMKTLSKVKNKRMPLKKLVICSILAALTGICSQIVIPLPFTPIPINLATLCVFISGGLLGARGGAVCQTIYLCLGLIGIPVFTQFGAGPGALIGPTGGYLIGYVIVAFLSGYLLEKLPKGMVFRVLAFTVGLVGCYIPGTMWFMASMGIGLLPSLMACVVPFLPGDALKIFAAALFMRRLEKAMHDF